MHNHAWIIWEISRWPIWLEQSEKVSEKWATMRILRCESVQSFQQNIDVSQCGFNGISSAALLIGSRKAKMKKDSYNIHMENNSFLV